MTTFLRHKGWDAEERHRRNDGKRHTVVLDSIFDCSGSLSAAKHNFGEKLNKELQDISQRQDYMNKYLSKLL